MRERSGNDAADLGTTSLALLAFLGAGYCPLTKSPVWDPLLQRNHSFDRVTKNAILWILSKQKEDGSFSPDPVTNVLAALATSENYEMTWDTKCFEPARKGITSVLASRSPDRSFLIWKGVLLGTVPGYRPELKNLGQILAQDESVPGRFGSLLLLRLGKTRDDLLPRMAELAPEDLSLEEIWIASTAAFKLRGRTSAEWRTFREKHFPGIKASAKTLTCGRGLEDGVPEDRVRTAAFQAFLLQRFYEYSCALLNYPEGN